MRAVVAFQRVRRGLYTSGEWRIIHTRREDHSYLPMWCCDRLNADGTEWFEGAAFGTLTEAKAYVAQRPGTSS